MYYKSLFSEFESDAPQSWTIRPVIADPKIVKFPQPGTRKIADLPKVCKHPEHEPPKFKVFEPGIYEHVCPACEHRTVFTVNSITF